MKLFAIVGIDILSPSCMKDPYRDAFLNSPLRPWAAAIREFGSAIREFRYDVENGVDLAPAIEGIAPRFVHEAVVQKVLYQHAYTYNFVRISQELYPHATTVVSMPRMFRQLLAKNGFVCNRELSNVVWWLSAALLRMLGVIACAYHSVLAIRGIFDSERLEVDTTNNETLIWFTPGITTHGGNAGGHFSQIDFIKSGRHEFFRSGSKVIVSGDRTNYEFDPALETKDLFAACRADDHDRWRPLSKILLGEIGIAFQILLGGWRAQLIAADLAKVPRARVLLRDLSPSRIIFNVGNLMSFPLWSALVVAKGGTREVFLNSAQVLQHHASVDTNGPTALEHYGCICGERIWVWNEAQKNLLMDSYDVDQAVEVFGPLMFSEQPPRIPDHERNGPIIIDIYDQPPLTDDTAIKIGAPRAFYLFDFCMKFIEDVVDVLENDFSHIQYAVRIKTKKQWYVQATYSDLLQSLARDKAQIELIHDRYSPLFLHRDADLTIGAPFVSPVDSASDSDVLSCYFDPLCTYDPQQPGSLGTPVILGRDDLSHWISDCLDVLSENNRAIPINKAA